MEWPQDADGDVFRRLLAADFDFDRKHEIDFYVDFADWPLPPRTRNEISNLFPNCEFVEPDDEDIEEGDLSGYVHIRITELLTYEFVLQKQDDITDLMKKYGGICEAWGVCFSTRDPVLENEAMSGSARGMRRCNRSRSYAYLSNGIRAERIATDFSGCRARHCRAAFARWGPRTLPGRSFPA